MEKIMLIKIIQEILVTKLPFFALLILDRQKFCFFQLCNALFYDTA